MTQAAIFGASGGIGPEIARRLAARGYQLALFDRDLPATQALAKNYPDSRCHAVDLSDSTQVTELCQNIVDSEETLDVAAINAGIIHPLTLTDSSPAQIDAQIDINLRAAIQIIRACALRMEKQGHGHILCTVSMGGLVALKGSATYSATKFGLRGLLIGLAAELKDKGIKVSGIHPSGVDTNMLRFEARNGGSALNFVSEPVSVEAVGTAFEQALDTGELEVFLSASDRWLGRLITSFPGLLYRLTPMMEKIGEQGRQKYLAKIGSE